jgi:hypothetical protein
MHTKRTLLRTLAVTLDRYPGTPVYLDVGAYVAAVGGPFQLNVTRAGYTSPIEVRQIAGGESRRLPAWVNDGWTGLRRFLHSTVRDPTGAVICGYNPFPLGDVWGARSRRGRRPGRLGAVPATAARQLLDDDLDPPRYTRLFGISAAHARTTVAIKVVKAPSCCGPAKRARHAAAAGSPTIAPIDNHPAPSTLPDLVPLPSFGISVDRQSGRDYLDFGATVWDHGPAPMDIEGFRRLGTNVMDAWRVLLQARRRGRPGEGRHPAV